VAECERAKAEAWRTLDVVGEASKPYAAALTPEQRDLSEAYDDALSEHLQATQDWYIAELKRHFPGLAPAFDAVWAHVRDEASASHVACCAEPEG
jgi:hypothetical protein